MIKSLTAAELTECVSPETHREHQATPMFEQFFAAKKAHPGCLLFFRMGDFYEMFFEDAEEAAPALDIALTYRGVHGARKVPMCGVPVLTCDSYLARLTKKGFRVAVCEQVETSEEARKRRDLVRREVVRVVTPGTLIDETLLEPKNNNFLAAIVRVRDETGIAFVDISTGEVETETTPDNGLAAALERSRPGEVVLSETLSRDENLALLLAESEAVTTTLPDPRFSFASAEKRLEEHYRVGSLDAFGEMSRAEIAACGAAIDYVELTQQGSFPALQRPRRIIASKVLGIDAATRRNLEISRSLGGRREDSLLAAVDRTVTAAGARRLAADLSQPLADAPRTEARHDRVAYLLGADEKRASVRTILKGTPDLARALSRVTLGRGGPRDLVAVARALRGAAEVRAILEDDPVGPPPAALRSILETMGDETELCALLESAIRDDPPVLARDGDFVREGYSTILDEQRSLRLDATRQIAEMQEKERVATGVASLKIRHNRVLGYFVEVPPTHAKRLQNHDDGRFRHRQTLAGVVRFSSQELAALADALSHAAERSLVLEREVFEELCQAVTARAQPARRTALAIAAVDVAQGFAELASERDYVRPQMYDDARFRIRGGRHPVVEAALGSGFVSNDCTFDKDKRIWLVTGPNMAGKSTFLRQNALIVLLAQAGSFVPAQSAEIGIVNRLFSRVGAADDLARGRSTFMVEMIEVAAILNQAGERAFVILDEVGRGTATFDGLSIAWATVEYLHRENRCRTLFATHYHELTALAESYGEISCHSLRVREWEGEVVFLHEVVAGVADRAYGIHVGRLAGLPPTVLARAAEILARLEDDSRTGPREKLSELPLFEESTLPPAPNPLTEALDAVDPDSLTPREALEFVYRILALREH